MVGLSYTRFSLAVMISRILARQQAILFFNKRNFGASFVLAQKHMPLIMLSNDKGDVFCS